jgi:hypothetical protein
MRAPDKNRYLRAVRHIESEEIPFQEDEIEHSVICRILGRQLPKVRPYELSAKDYVELNIACGNDFVLMANLWELGRKNFIDSEGRKHYVDGTMKTREDLKKIVYPDLGLYRKRIEELLAAVEGTGLGIKYTPGQAPFLVTTAVGYQDYYMDLILDPDFIHEFQRRLAEFCHRELEMALSYPIDVFQVGAVICSCAGPMFSREMIEEFEYPDLRRRIQAIKSKGRVVSAHLDGNVASLMPDLIAMGVDVINPIEPCEGRQDIYRLKELYGTRIALHGNIDLAGVLAFGTPADVERDVIAHIERLAVGGGYVCASSHNISEAVPLTNFYALRDTVQRYLFRRAAAV